MPSDLLITCPYCKKKFPSGPIECPNPKCAMYLPEEFWPIEKIALAKTLRNKYCFACGQQIDARAEICPKCGVRQPVTESKPGMENRPTTLVADRRTVGLFAIFLGGLGFHKFYLGQVRSGIFYLLFFWTFIPAILGFFEGIKILRMSDSEFKSEYDQAK